jgi:hypothetical protein
LKDFVKNAVHLPLNLDYANHKSSKKGHT